MGHCRPSATQRSDSQPWRRERDLPLGDGASRPLGALQGRGGGCAGGNQCLQVICVKTLRCLEATRAASRNKPRPVLIWSPDPGRASSVGQGLHHARAAEPEPEPEPGGGRAPRAGHLGVAATTGILQRAPGRSECLGTQGAEKTRSAPPSWRTHSANNSFRHVSIAGTASPAPEAQRLVQSSHVPAGSPGVVAVYGEGS